MSFKAFLYRRLSPWITCELKIPFDSKIELSSKYDVSSFYDVFCHPFYWQIFKYLDQENLPNLVVDCGAHCGHFTILSEVCIRTKSRSANTQYILVEPNPFLIPVIEKNIKDANINSRADIQQGLLGNKAGVDTLWINNKNYLTSSLQPQENSKPYQVSYINLLKLVGEQKIDLMKIDIEGGEYEFIPANLQLLSRTNLLFIEIHSATEQIQYELYNSLESVGLRMVDDPIKNDDHQLLIFQRQPSV
jgi:FkbM family methyltransferase